MIDELRRMAMFGSGVVELTRYRAEQMVKSLVRSGDVAPSGAQAMVQDLLERSKQTRRELTRFVREEIKNQIEGLGLATKRDVERLERRVKRLEDNLKKVREDSSGTRGIERRIEKLERSSASPSTVDSPGTKPKSTTKKSSTRKVTAQKTTGRTSDTE